MALIYDYDEARHTLKYPARPVREEATAVQPKRQRLELSARPVGGGMYLCESSPGLPWRDGQLYLEHDPALAPVFARGLGSDPGVYWRLRTMPQTISALDDLTSAVVTSPWRLVRDDLPDWAANDPAQVAAADRHAALADRIWYHWSHCLGQRGLRALITEKIEFSFVCGFSLHEILLEPRVMNLGDGPRLYLFPNQIPELRAPWSVKKWLTQCEFPIGVVQTLSQVMDTNGNTGAYEVVIPWRKLDHFTLRQAGPTDLEGLSALRPARRALMALQQVYQLQALSVEVNGVGTITLSKDNAEAPPLTEAQREEVALFFDSYKAEHMPWFIPPDGYSFRIVSAQTTVPDLSSQVQIYSNAAGMALNQSHKLIGLHSHGSFAARAAATDAAAESYMLPTVRVADNLSGLLRRILRANFPQDEVIFAPRVEFAHVNGEAVKLYSDAGYITPDAGDEDIIREDLGLPRGSAET